MKFKAGQDIVVDRIGQVIQEVLVWSDSGHETLHEVTQDGQHSQPAILHLLQLQVFQRLLVFPKSKGVKQGSARVGWFSGPTQILLESQEILLAHGTWFCPVLEPPVLCESHECHLENKQRVWICPVAVCPGRWDDTSPEPREGGLRRYEASLSKNFWCNGTNRPQHGISSVNDLTVG